MSEEDILKGFVGIIEEHFPKAKTFLPRYVDLGESVYVNDENIDRQEEYLEDEELECSEEVAKVPAKDLGADTSCIPISSVDASSARLGETDKGIISAVRVAIWKQEPEKKPILSLYGPYIAHITPENVDYIYNYFRCEVFGMDKGSPPKIPKMTDRLRNFFERLGQRQAAGMIKKGITLWDGSLRGATVDTPLDLLRESVKRAFDNQNSVVGISKYSTLRTESGERIIGMLEKNENPCLVEVQSMISAKLTAQILGRVHVAKFSPDGFSFRVDVAACPGLECNNVLQALKGNCLFFNGYPDALRQVHVHAYFTPNELLSLQNLAVEKYRMRVLRSFDIRKHILAPYE